MVSYALMNLVMTSTPLAVVGCGYNTNNAADVVTAHVLAMYVPSFFTGHLIARFGSQRIVALGLFILAGSGAVALTGVALENFFVALILLGLGWNFCFVGGSTLLADQISPTERAKTQGVNDLLIGLATAAASLGSGLIFAFTSYTMMGIVGIVLSLVPLGLTGWWMAAGRRLETAWVAKRA